MFSERKNRVISVYTCANKSYFNDFGQRFIAQCYVGSFDIYFVNSTLFSGTQWRNDQRGC